MVNEFDPFMLDLFRSELETHARTLQAGLASPDAVEPLMRAAHSIKGAARIVSLEPAVELAGAMEEMLSPDFQPSPGTVEALQSANAIFLELSELEAAAIPAALDARAEAIMAAAQAVRQAMIAQPSAPHPAAPAPATPPPPAEAPPADPFMLDLFRTELETHARTLEAGLVKAEADQTPAAIEPLMRAAHSVKGAARMVGLDLGVQLAHAMEDILSAAQRGERRLTSQAVDKLLAANDIFLKLSGLETAAIPAALAAQAAPIGVLSKDLREAMEQAPEAPPPAPVPPVPEAAPVAADPFMLELFRTELETHARLLETALVQAESDQSPGAIEPLMRAAHSIKGAARMVGLDLGVQLAHAMEDMLSAAQRGEYRLTSPDVDRLLAANDIFLRLSTYETAAIPGALAKEAATIAGTAQAIREAMQHPGSAPAPAPAPAAPTPAPAGPEPPKAAGDESVRVFVENLNRLTGLAGECLVEARGLKPLASALQRIKHHQSLLAIAVERAMEALHSEAVHDLQSRLEDALHQIDRVDQLVPAHINEFDRFSRRLELLANKLYDESVASRMRPFSDGLHGFSRMVRDLAKSLGKLVHFEIRGEATHVDRDILEKLEAPLNHLLRNAVDHGVEAPEVRIAAGKPPEARLTLEARHVSGVLEIVVADDGGGIDLDRLRKKVLDRGYGTEEIITNLSQAELLDFLFLPGFSTAQTVTEISGRGVGLDIVQSMVRAVGGNIRIDTKLGRGSTFTLQLPLTLSVVRTLLVEIAREVYALPLTRIDQILRLPPADLQTVEDRQFCRYGEQSIGLVDACQVLELPQVPRESEELAIVVVSDRLNRYGLVVGRFLGQRDLAVVPFHQRLGRIPNLSAGAILEDGTPVLILDGDDLVRSIDNLLGRGGLRKVGQRERAVRSGRKRVLVVDDSLTVREVERRLLENRGYDVAAAVDGVDGWNAVQSGGFDLVVTDVDMPRMDGIELVRRIKQSSLTAQIPVMIVSYKDQKEYRLRGLEAGASYYLTKSSFQDQTLVNAVRDLIGEAQRQ